VLSSAGHRHHDNAVKVDAQFLYVPLTSDMLPRGTASLQLEAEFARHGFGLGLDPSCLGLGLGLD